MPWTLKEHVQLLSSGCAVECARCMFQQTLLLSETLPGL